MKVGIPDPKQKKERIVLEPNRGNALINGIRAVLQSKTSTEELELKVSMLRRMQEMEQQLTDLEEYFMQQAAKGQERKRLQ
jgi:hypothetical protein